MHSWIKKTLIALFGFSLLAGTLGACSRGHHAQLSSEDVAQLRDKVADKLDPLTEQYGGLFKKGLRTPVMRKPSDYGMAFEEVWFPSMDGVPLEAWFIPAAASDKLAMASKCPR